MTPPQPQPSKIGKDRFLELVGASGLIPPDRLTRALIDLPATDRGRVLARSLVNMGLLTKFQAERLLAGKTDGFLMGQYRILDELGRGGMGWVFKAEHMTMGRVVALKILSGNLTRTEKARQLFHREVKAAARLNHPHIVTAFDANQIGNRCFLVMEFVDGLNLLQLVKKNGPLPVAQACEYVRQAGIGLQYAHDLGMVHRDIKPANLLVQNKKNKAGEITSITKILDFGLARLNASEDGTPGHDSIFTQPQAVMGTPDFLSPEQARNLHATDGRSDIYSLGCTLYYLLTAKVPFPGGTTMEKLVRHSTEQPPSPCSDRSDIPHALGAIVLKMIAKKPAERVQSAAELATMLLPFAEKEGSNWTAVEQIALQNDLPVSNTPISIELNSEKSEDPWANIDDDSSQIGTLSGETAPTALSASKPRFDRQPSQYSNIWTILVVFLVLAVGISMFLALRYLFFKA